MDSQCRKETIKEICRILGISVPKVVFVKGLKAFGTYYKVSQVILIRDNLPIDREVYTLSHELRHVQQHKIYGSHLFSSINSRNFNYDTDWYEIDASIFGFKMLEYFRLGED